jgi:hypothetical protein
VVLAQVAHHLGVVDQLSDVVDLRPTLMQKALRINAFGKFDQATLNSLISVV